MPQELVPLVYEHILSSHYGWTTEYIATLDHAEVQARVQMCLIEENINREFQLKLAGADLSKKMLNSV